MKTIPEKFTHDVYTHFLIQRQGAVAIFAKTQTHGKGSRWEYETIVIRIRPASEIMGKAYPESERMPGDEEFGTFGWHYNNLGAAQNKFAEVVALKSPGEPLLVHPNLDQFRNSITVQMFDSQRRPAGSFPKRAPADPKAIPPQSLIPAIKSPTGVLQCAAIAAVMRGQTAISTPPQPGRA